MSESGIYKIKCLINGKFYVGSSINLQKRKGTHFGDLKENRHSNKYFQNAWNKYGEDSFEFEVLEECPKTLLIEREQHYLDTLTPWKREIGYNIYKDAKSRLGMKCSEESKEKMRQAKLGKKRFPHREETKEKIGNANSGEQCGSCVLTWESVAEIRNKYKTNKFTQKELSEHYKVVPSTIQAIINNRSWVTKDSERIYRKFKRIPWNKKTK